MHNSLGAHNVKLDLRSVRGIQAQCRAHRIERGLRLVHTSGIVQVGTHVQALSVEPVTPGVFRVWEQVRVHGVTTPTASTRESNRRPLCAPTATYWFFVCQSMSRTYVSRGMERDLYESTMYLMPWFA